ncbi:hypothetical protein PUR28_27880 [Streptomyces sp. BE308]|uniref:hypothetical protein n=1 Tax=Streptomyces sp. BE308 TaxID=3002529 RepID=UPI002E78613C|nr:hypothetical protein [Streptomyces sp. BE308]MEE1794548.1 hypothetical protein [Streptomyces sp. BE308]
MEIAFTFYRGDSLLDYIPVHNDLKTAETGSLIHNFEEDNGYRPVLLDLKHSLIYRIATPHGIDELTRKRDPGNHLETKENDRLLCATLAYGEQQPIEVTQRLFCGSNTGKIFTFPWNGNGRGGDPTPYIVTAANGDPIQDLAVHSDGTIAYALIQRKNGSGQAALAVVPVKGSGLNADERPTWDVIDDPCWVTITDDDRYVVVTGHRHKQVSVIDTKENRLQTYDLPLEEGEYHDIVAPWFVGESIICVPFQNHRTEQPLIKGTYGGLAAMNVATGQEVFRRKEEMAPPGVGVNMTCIGTGNDAEGNSWCLYGFAGLTEGNEQEVFQAHFYRVDARTTQLDVTIVDAEPGGGLIVELVLAAAEVPGVIGP